VSTIFLSYSSDQAETAARIELSLREDGHAVFRDRTSLPPGESFDAQIRQAVAASDLFVFLITRNSVSAGHYTLTELKFAQEKWGNPSGHVLPVVLEAVPSEAIPAFLRAVTILKPIGNVTAEVAGEVARMSSPWRRTLRPRRLALLIVAASVLAGGTWLKISVDAGAIVRQGHLLAVSGDYAAAWSSFERAGFPAGLSSEVREAQEQLAMDWLDHARSSQLKGTPYGTTLGDIAKTVLPVLSRGAAAAKGERAADLLAHMGWADFLRMRDGVGGLDPTQRYRRAIEIDPKNVFAHAMWGHWILVSDGPLAEAKAHFALALESGRKREYVRIMEIAALQWIDRPELQDETIRVANEIRAKGETMPVADPDRPLAWQLWNVYYSRLVVEKNKAPFLAALPPADHLATFRWLYPADLLKDPRADRYKYFAYLSILALLQENAGDRPGALESSRLLLGEFADNKFTSYLAVRVADEARSAVKRLSR
jgi:TIR domain-containing protein